mmetsp:Transcript_1098/g.3335  ORF Transcript_1098/g.3335 Transcript_1098/m.3335 type:complete len:501 (+) Transcript_1098:476-1978(+)
MQPLEERCPGRGGAGEELLGRAEAVRLCGAPGCAALEGADDPVAVGRDLLEVVLLVLEVPLVVLQVAFLVLLLLFPVCNRLLQVVPLGFELLLQRLGSRELLLEAELSFLLGLHAALDLIAEVLDEHGEELDDAFGLVLPRSPVREAELGCLVGRGLKVWSPLRQEEAFLWRARARAVRVVGGEELLRLQQQLHGLLVLLLGALEGGMLVLALVLHVLHVLFQVLDRLGGALLLLAKVLDEPLQLVDGCLVLLDEPADLGDAALGLLVLLEALVALLRVLGGLLLELSEHLVDGLDDLVEMAGLGRAEPRGEGREAQALGPGGRGPQGGVGARCWGGPRVSSRELKQRRGVHAGFVGLVYARLPARLDGGGEELPGLVAAEDLQRLRDALELLGPELLPCGPGLLLGLTRLLGLVEEGDVGLHLRLGVVVALRALSKHRLRLRLLLLLLGRLLLQQRQLLGLLCHQGLKVPVLATLSLRGAFEVCAEGGVHVPEDALYRP